VSRWETGFDINTTKTTQLHSKQTSSHLQDTITTKAPSKNNVHLLSIVLVSTPMNETKIKNQKEWHRPSNISKIMPVCITFIKISKIFLSNDIIT
jgi:hypothetical protein